MANLITREFPASLLKELDVPWGGKCVVEDKIVDTTRWTVVHEVVFAYEGRHYRVDVHAPATERQDDMDPFNECDPVTCIEVEQVERLVKVWEPVRPDEA